MLRFTLFVFYLSSVFFAEAAYAQTNSIESERQMRAAPTIDITQVPEANAIHNAVNGYEVTSVNSTKNSSFEPTPFIDAYELGFITDDTRGKKQELTQTELAKIKQSFDIPKSEKDKRYKPVFNIRAGEEKPEWQRDNYYPAGR